MEVQSCAFYVFWVGRGAGVVVVAGCQIKKPIERLSVSPKGFT